MSGSPQQGFRLSPMEAKLVADLPDGPGWQYEPKWDGFRALVFRDKDEIELLSKSGKSLARYFPEIVEMIASIEQDRFTLDGELILPMGQVLSFDALQARLHPAPSRIAKLSRETPAQLMLFDCLHSEAQDLRDSPLRERRAALEEFHRRHGGPSILLSDYTISIEDARSWLETSGGALDGVVAKLIDEPYRSGERAMLKVKHGVTSLTEINRVTKD